MNNNSKLFIILKDFISMVVSTSTLVYIYI